MKGTANKVNHKQLIRAVAEATGDSKDIVEKHINCYIDAIMDQACAGHNVGIRYLGTLKIDRTKPKRVYSFKEKQKIIRPSSPILKMSFGREFSCRIKSHIE